MAKGIGPVKLTRADQKILKSYIPLCKGWQLILAAAMRSCCTRWKITITL